MNAPLEVVVRRATPDDAADLVRVRAWMFDGMGHDAGADDDPWRSEARDRFATWLADPGLAAAFVAVDPSDGVVAGAVGLVDRRIPSPGRLEDRGGRVLSVATHPEHRRRGLARACVGALLDWFEHEAGVPVVDLAASPDGEPLYRTLGFTPSYGTALRLSRH